MIHLFETALVPILIALAIGIVVGWWLYRRPASRTPIARPSEAAAPPPAPVEEPIETLAAQAAEPLPPTAGPPDNLQTMKGVGPKLAARLNELGILRFDQLAALSPAQADALDTQLDQFNGRIKRDRLVEQAEYLARGELDAYQKTFGNLGGGEPAG